MFLGFERRRNDIGVFSAREPAVNLVERDIAQLFGLLLRQHAVLLFELGELCLHLLFCLFVALALDRLTQRMDATLGFAGLFVRDHCGVGPKSSMRALCSIAVTPCGTSVAAPAATASRLK